jgi:hypothetical protein
MRRHPIHAYHEAVAREVRSWYNSPAPEIGLSGDQHWFGFLSTSNADRARLVPSIDEAKDVPAALSAARTACSSSRLTVMVDDRIRAARLDAALRQLGCNAEEATTFLALVGQLRPQAGLLVWS